MTVDLSRVKERQELKPQREPYWQRLRPGCFLGYRPSWREGRGTWIARAYDEDLQRYKLKALGDFPRFAGSEQFAAAKIQAESFAHLVEMGGIESLEIETVEQACRAFGDRNPDAEGRFRRHVYDDPIARVKLVKLRRHHVEAWRQRLDEKPALVSRNKKGPKKTRPRAPSSINRDRAVLRTALGRVLALGPPNSEAAWQEPLKPIKNAVRRRTLYLDRGQRRALLANIEEEVAPFVRGLCLLPLRPGAVARLTAGDYDKSTRELTIGHDKAGQGRRIRVPEDIALFFVAQKKDKLPSAPLFSRADGQAWTKETWKFPIAEAARAAGLPPGVCAYTLRHSTITDLVSSRLPLLTIAQISGTSVAMIEKHYGHLDRAEAEQALACLSL
jgi:integrase